MTRHTIAVAVGRTFVAHDDALGIYEDGEEFLTCDGCEIIDAATYVDRLDRLFAVKAREVAEQYLGHRARALEVTA